jgi:hypothetical protein
VNIIRHAYLAYQPTFLSLQIVHNAIKKSANAIFVILVLVVWFNAQNAKTDFTSQMANA